LSTHLVSKEELRQVVARLKSVYTKEQLEGRQVVVLCNLPPAEIKGVKSEGMMLVAEEKKKDKTSLLQPSEKVSDEDWLGLQFEAKGTDPAWDKPITLKDFQKLDLKISKDGKVVFKTNFPVVSKSSQLTAEGVSTSAKIK
jgi:tRNA-binding EMAP/Myf-like protein